MSKPNELAGWLNDRIDFNKLDKVRDLGPVLSIIRERVAHYLETDPGLLMSYLYRLDVLESRLRPLFEKGSAPRDLIDDIAELILERQIQRIKTKKKFGKTSIEEEGWEW